MGRGIGGPGQAARGWRHRWQQEQAAGASLPALAPGRGRGQGWRSRSVPRKAAVGGTEADAGRGWRAGTEHESGCYKARHLLHSVSNLAIAEPRKDHSAGGLSPLRGDTATVPSGQPLEHLPRSPVGGWDPRGRFCCLLRGRRSRAWLPAAERSGSSALGRASAPRAGRRRVRAALLPPRSVPCCQLAEGPLALPAGHSLAAARARRRRGGKKPAHRSQPRVPGRLGRPCLRSGLPKVRGHANRSPRAHQYPPRRPRQGDTEGARSSPET